MTIKNRILSNKTYGLWLTILLLTAIIQLAGWEGYLRYDRDLISAGQYWLMISAHFTHFGWSHWALNMAGMVIVAIFFSVYGNLFQWLSVVLCSALFVSFGLYWFKPDIGWYVGLSGVLHGMFFFSFVREIKYYPTNGVVLLVLLVSKLVWERFNGALPGSEEMAGGRVLTDAHLYGAIGGAVCTAILLLAIKYRQRKPASTGPVN